MKRQFEIERKYRIQNPSVMRRRILETGAKLDGKGAEKNELFDFKGSLRRRGAILRLRRFSASAFLTFKGPRVKGIFKKRIEAETPVHYEAVKSILELAGFRAVAKYNKRRESFKLGPAHITLDYLSGFGWFMEIEAAPKTILALQKKLGLSEKQREDRSYPQMVYGSKNWR